MFTVTVLQVSSSEIGQRVPFLPRRWGESASLLLQALAAPAFLGSQHLPLSSKAAVVPLQISLFLYLQSHCLLLLTFLSPFCKFPWDYIEPTQ